MKKLYLGLVCVMSSALFAAEATSQIFSFDDGKIGSGEKIGMVRDNEFATVSATFPAGLRGKGILLDRQELAFPVKGLITPQNGTVSFWFKPLTWSQGAEDFLPLFAVDSGRGHGWKMLCYYNYRPAKEPCGFITIQLFSKSEKVLTVLQMPTYKNLRFGDWNHLAIAWNGSSVSLGFNGKQFLRRDLPKDFVMRPAHVKDCAVIMPARFWGKRSEVQTLVDEVTFFPVALDEEAIASIFSAR